jgi:hypothetical protein
MQTPWGNLREIDLNDHSTAEKIISADKHRLVEGLVAECIFDQIFQKVPASSDCKILPLDVETIIVDTNNTSERWIALVWARTKTEGLGRYLLALERGFVPYLLEYDPLNGFSATKRENGRSSAQLENLADLMERLSGGAYTEFTVNASVRDETRQKQAFWGHVSNYYGNRVGHQIVLPRLLLNCGVQPYFRRVWNLDRMLLVDDQVWMLEVKHKFPMELPPKNDYPTLRFGINEGELGIIDKLVNCGIRCLHTVLVKPFWSTEAGPMYLLNDLASREKTALVAAVLDQTTVGKMMAGRSGKAAAHTSINGESKIKYRSLPARSFKDLGVLSDAPENIAKKIVSTMKGESVSFVHEAHLLKLRCPILK